MPRRKVAQPSGPAAATTLTRIWEALSELPTQDDLDAAGALLRKRYSQILMMADYQSIAENRFEPGDAVVVRGGGVVYQVVSVGRRSLRLSTGRLSKPAKVVGAAVKAPRDDTVSYQARHLVLADRLLSEARRAYHQLAKG